MASGTAASVKLYATGLQRPRVLAVKIELMSACGTFETWRRTLRVSVYRGRPEVTGRSSKWRFWPQAEMAHCSNPRLFEANSGPYQSSGLIDMVPALGLWAGMRRRDFIQLIAARQQVGLAQLTRSSGQNGESDFLVHLACLQLPHTVWRRSALE